MYFAALCHFTFFIVRTKMRWEVANFCKKKVPVAFLMRLWFWQCWVTPHAEHGGIISISTNLLHPQSTFWSVFRNSYSSGFRSKLLRFVLAYSGRCFETRSSDQPNVGTSLTTSRCSGRPVSASPGCSRRPFSWRPPSSTSVCSTHTSLSQKSSQKLS